VVTRPSGANTGASKKCTPYRAAVLGEALGPFQSDGGHLDPGQAGVGGQEPVRPVPRLLGGGPVGQHGYQDPGALDGFGRAGRYGRAVLDESRGVAGVAVPRSHPCGEDFGELLAAVCGAAD
jgi:hypothetical protein